MSRSTGPILAIGAVTVANQTLFNGRPLDWRVPIATGLSVGVFALLEKAAPDVAGPLAWMALITVLLARVQPGIPSPAESFLKWWEEK